MSKEIDLSETVREIKEQVRESENVDLEEILEEEKKGKDRKTLKEFLEKEIEERPEKTESEEKEEKEPLKRQNNSSQGVNLSVKQFAGLSFSAGFLLGVALTLSVVVLGGLGSSDAGAPTVEAGGEDDTGDLEALSEIPYDVEFGVGTENVEWDGQTVELEDRPYMGSSDADVVMVSYEDYFCPFCAGFHNPDFAAANNMNSAFGDIAENHIATGEVQYYFKNFPVVGGERPAEVSECFAEHGSSEDFWTFNHNHFQNFEQLSELQQTDPNRYDEVMISWAEQMDLDTEAVQACMDDSTQASTVQADAEEGQSLGASATPTNFIEGEMLEGAQPYSAFETVINDKLQQQ